MKTVEVDIEAENNKTMKQVPKNLSQSNWKAAIGVFSEKEDEVEITLIYSRYMLHRDSARLLTFDSGSFCDLDCRIRHQSRHADKGKAHQIDI